MVQYELSCYEIGGNEPVDQIDPRQILDADAILLVFSLGSPDAIQQIRFYQARLAQIAPDVPLFLVGTKTATGEQEGEQRLANEVENMARNWNTRGFWQTSVSAGLNAQGLLASITALPRSAGKTALKVIFAGPAGSGKTALILRLTDAELNGTYEPTVGTWVSTVNLEVPAPTPLVMDAEEEVPTEPEELRQQGVIIEKIEESKSDFTKEGATPEPELRPSPMGAGPKVPATTREFQVVKDEMMGELNRLKKIEREGPPPAGAAAGGTAPPPPGRPTAPGGPPPTHPQALRGSIMGELKQLFERKVASSEGPGEPPTPPSGPVTPSPEVTKEPVQPAPVTAGGEVLGMEVPERHEATPVPPTFNAPTPPPTPPTPAPVNEEGGRDVARDDTLQGKKRKYKQVTKAETRKLEKMVAEEEEEEISAGIDKTAGGLGGMAPPTSATTVTVERVLERKSTVFYRKQMNPLTRNKLSVVLSTLKIYEQLKLQTVVPADRAGGQQTLKIKELSPFVHVQPVFPGCICVPAEMPLDARKDSDTADFHITPLATGPVMDACVRLYYEGKLVDTIQTPTKVVNQTSAKISVLAAVFFPIFGPLFDERIGPFLASAIPFWEQIGGFENFFLILAGALGFLSTILYYIHRPKQAVPIEANFPELQKFLEEDVQRPGLADVLKEKSTDAKTMQLREQIENLVHELMQAEEYVLGASVLDASGQILYQTENWDITDEVPNILAAIEGSKWITIGGDRFYFCDYRPDFMITSSTEGKGLVYICRAGQGRLVCHIHGDAGVYGRCNPIVMDYARKIGGFL